MDRIEDRPHPAAFPDPILAELRKVVPKGDVLDPFAGVGRLGRLGPGWRVHASEIEPEWANQCEGNGCVKVHCGDSRHLPWADDTFDAIATSPSYGNRLSDAYAPTEKDPEDGRRSHRTRRSYRIFLGRPLDPANGGGMPWNDDYRKLHWDVLRECVHVLKPGGLFVLDIKDHVRKGMLQQVPEWWHRACIEAGLTFLHGLRVPMSGDQNQNRHRKQGKPTIDHEEILVFRLPRNP